MKTKFLRVMSIGLALLLMGAMVAACGGGGTPASQTSGTTTAKKSEAEDTSAATAAGETASADEMVATEGPISFSLFVGRKENDSEGPIIKLLEEKLNMDVEFVGLVPDDQVNTKLNLMLASDDLPDLYPTNWNEAIIRSGAPFGIEAMQKFMPESYAFLNDAAIGTGLNPDSVWNRFTDENGVLHGIPNVWYGGTEPRPVIWRKDILDELGMAVPTTIQEAAEVFAAFKEKYPDKYPMTGTAKDIIWQSFTDFMGSVGMDFFQKGTIRDGKIVFNCTQPEFREILEILAGWQQKGYIDPSWVTMTETDRNNEFINGNSILLEWNSVMNTIPPYRPGSMIELCAAVNPEATFANGGKLKLHDDVTPAAYTWFAFTGGTQAFNKKLMDDKGKMYRIMEMYEAMFADPEISVISLFGVEGETYEVLDDGSYNSLPGCATAEEKYDMGVGFVAPYVGDGGYGYQFYYSSSVLQAKEEAFGPGGILAEGTFTRNFTKITSAILDEDGTDLEAMYYPNLEAKRDEMFVSVISGAKPIEAFDEFVEYFYANGGTELEENANRLFLEQWQ